MLSSNYTTPGYKIQDQDQDSSILKTGRYQQGGQKAAKVQLLLCLNLWYSLWELINSDFAGKQSKIDEFPMDYITHSDTSGKIIYSQNWRT